jgi:PEP-CTERM motif
VQNDLHAKFKEFDVHKSVLAIAAFAAATIASPASAVVINFDNLGNGVQVTNQYPGVIFSSQAGSRILTTAQNLGSSTPNFICSAAVGGSINCVDDVYLDFTTAVSGLSFVSVGDNNVGDVGDVRVFAGATLLGTVDIIVDGVFATPHVINLSAFAGITRIEIARITDGGGLGYDDFTFTVGAVNGAVPEASTWAMMLAGFGAIGAAMRRRARQFAIA